METNINRKRQEIFWEPWKVTAALITAAAALLAVGVAGGLGLAKILWHLN